MRLYFLRHGIAEERSSSLPDANRQLIPKGRERIQQLANRLADFDVRPVIVYTSPLPRAEQTAQIVAEHQNIPLEATDLLDYVNFNSRTMQELVDRHAEDEDIMVVGHEPTFSDTISYIIGGGNITMKKGGLARIDLYSKHPLHGTLVWLLAPKVV